MAPATGFALLNMDNPVLRAYLFYAALVVLKAILSVYITTFYRFKHKVFLSKEDLQGKPGKSIVAGGHPDVDRGQGIQRNDLENIPYFLILGLLYTVCDPPVVIATNVFRIFFWSRLVHTLVYLMGLQPHRALVFFAGVFCNLYMIYQIISKVY